MLITGLANVTDLLGCVGATQSPDPGDPTPALLLDVGVPGTCKSPATEGWERQISREWSPQALLQEFISDWAAVLGQDTLLRHTVPACTELLRVCP